MNEDSFIYGYLMAMKRFFSLDGLFLSFKMIFASLLEISVTVMAGLFCVFVGGVLPVLIYAIVELIFDVPFIVGKITYTISLCLGSFVFFHIKDDDGFGERDSESQSSTSVFLILTTLCIVIIWTAMHEATDGSVSFYF